MAQQQKQHVHIINVVEWFSQDGDELKMWCSEFDTLACRDHINLARQAMRVNVNEEECETIMEILGCLNQLQLISKAATELSDS